MNNYKEPEMDEVELNEEDLCNVNGGACASKQHLDELKVCAPVQSGENDSIIIIR